GYGIIARDLQRVGRSVFSGGLVQRDVDAVNRVLDSVALRRNRDGVVNEDFGVLGSYAFRHAIRLRPAAAIVQHGLQAREVAGAVGAVLHFNGRDLAFSASGVCRNNKAMRLVAFAGTGIHQRSADFQIGTGVDSLNHVFKRRLVRIDRNGMGRVAHREFDIDLAAAAFHQRFSTLFTGVAGKRLSSGQLLNRDRIIARNGVGASFSAGGERFTGYRRFNGVESLALAEIGRGGGDGLEPGFQGSIGGEALLLFGSATLQGGEGGVFCRTQLFEQRIERQP